jgi:hypothetical protein
MTTMMMVVIFVVIMMAMATSSWTSITFKIHHAVGVAMIGIDNTIIYIVIDVVGSVLPTMASSSSPLSGGNAAIACRFVLMLM